MKHAFLLLLAIPLSSFAQENGYSPMKDVESFKAKLKEAQQKTSTVKSQFVQEKHLSFMEDKVVSKGLFFLKKQGKMRIEYTSPFVYLVVFNGDKLYIKDGKKTTKIDTKTDKSFRQLNEVMTHSMNGEIDQIKGFAAKYFQSKDYALVELTPNQAEMQKMFDKIKLYLHPQSFQVAKLDLLEKSGDRTEMRFEQTQTNVPIPDETFLVR